MTIKLFLLNNDLCNVFKKVALVYAEPITDDIAAAKITTPKIFFPIGPIACSNTDAGGLSAFKVTPVTTTPSTAKNNNVLIIPVVKIPAIAERFTNGKNSLPFIPESSILCAPANVMYPPTVPPTKVIIGKINLMGCSGATEWISASP